MHIGAKIGLGVVLVAGGAAAGIVEWGSLTSGAGTPKTAEEIYKTYGGGAEEEPEPIEGACYTGPWVGCWRFVDDPTRSKFITISEDGCEMTQAGLEDQMHIVYGFTTTERETIGPEEASFEAPAGSVVFYVVPTKEGDDANPQMAVDSRRDETGRVRTNSGVYRGWMVLSLRGDGQRTLAAVSRFPDTSGSEAPAVPEYRLSSIPCP